MQPTTILKLVVVMFLWASCFPLIATALDLAPHLTFAALRALLAGATLLAIGVALRRPFPRGVRVWLRLSAIGLGATTFAFLGMFHAAEFVSPGIATVIANTQPLMAAILAHALLGERLGHRGKLGLAVGFAGIVTIAFPELFSTAQESSVVGFAYIILAALGITVSNVLIKRSAGTVDPLMGMGAQLIVGGLPLVLAAMIFEAPETVQWSLRFTSALLALALPGTALVYWLWCSLLQTVELNKANAFSFLIPIFGLTMGVGLFGEHIAWHELTGAGLTVLGLDLVVRHRHAAVASSGP